MGYEHVVIHTRLTERWKIDPAYVDASTFWRLEDRRGKMDITHSTRENITRPLDSIMEYAIQPDTDVVALAGGVGIPVEQMATWVKEYKRRGTVQSRYVYKYEEMSEAEERSDELYRRNILHNS